MPPATPEQLFARLDALGIRTATVTHPPMFTVADSRALRGSLAGTHCKCLFLRDKRGGMWLVATAEDRAVDLKALAAKLGTGRLSFGSPERLMAHLGVVPGAVTPFALINDEGRRVTPVIDRALLDAEVVNFHPLVNTMTTSIRPADLIRFIEISHRPLICDLGGEGRRVATFRPNSHLLGMAEMILGKPDGGTAPADVIKNSDTAHFMADVIEASQKTPVIVDFWAPWCGPCKQLTPIIEKVVKAARGAVRLVKINVDENQQLAAQLRIQSIPTVFAFAGGRPVDGFAGALPESQVKAFVDRLVGATAGAQQDSPIADALKQAKALLEAGDAKRAAALYGQIVAAEPDNVAAIAGLARAHIAVGEPAKAREALDRVPDAKKNDSEIAAAKAALDLAEKSKAAGNLGELEAKLAADPNDHQARFDLALGLYGMGRREEAIDELITIVRRDREWNDQAARKQLVQFFEALGPKDPLTLAGRRKLSSTLFS